VIRKAFRMAVNPQETVEYERRHSPIWPELQDVLRAHGVHDYSIFLDETDGSLFGYVEIEDEARWDAIARTPECHFLRKCSRAPISDTGGCPRTPAKRPMTSGIET